MWSRGDDQRLDGAPRANPKPRPWSPAEPDLDGLALGPHRGLLRREVLLLMEGRGQTLLSEVPPPRSGVSPLPGRSSRVPPPGSRPGTSAGFRTRAAIGRSGVRRGSRPPIPLPRGRESSVEEGPQIPSGCQVAGDIGRGSLRELGSRRARMNRVPQTCLLPTSSPSASEIGQVTVSVNVCLTLPPLLVAVTVSVYVPAVFGVPLRVTIPFDELDQVRPDTVPVCVMVGIG
jgi:hypothetical protein